MNYNYALVFEPLEYNDLKSSWSDCFKAMLRWKQKSCFSSCKELYYRGHPLVSLLEEPEMRILFYML